MIFSDPELVVPRYYCLLYSQSIQIGKGVIRIIQFSIIFHPVRNRRSGVGTIHFLHERQHPINACADTRRGPNISVNDPSGMRNPMDVWSKRCDPRIRRFVRCSIPTIQNARSSCNGSAGADSNEIAKGGVCGSDVVDGSIDVGRTGTEPSWDDEDLEIFWGSAQRVSWYNGLRTVGFWLFIAADWGLVVTGSSVGPIMERLIGNWNASKFRASSGPKTSSA